ncbi:hypothetical protein AN958_07704 [Leucoagaricus sp. SymC.cos]|nr:hypothetical protein AN958_07704 [Leucoagaricus sp. SymC.cos]
MAAVQTQPSTVKPSFRSLLSLPSRICNPPPAVGKVRSFGVTPLFSVRLDDVLDRKHLPPLGLKDFEEWLLYVELCPENLYFILWLREYRTRYAAWQKQCNSPSDAPFASAAASRLAAFYTRAKQTFLSPNTNYELNLSSTILAPFQEPGQDPHPDPSTFRDVEQEVRRMLEQSLRRFIQAQMTNVGNRRVLCGIIAGVLVILFGFIPPITTNFVNNQPRWLRMTVFPGLWIGLTILLSALHGVCLAVYIFGDLRQLRKFELARPVAPKLHKTSLSAHFSPPSVSLPSPPTTAYGRSHRHRQRRPGSFISATEFSDATVSVYSREVQPFPISPGQPLADFDFDGLPSLPKTQRTMSVRNGSSGPTWYHHGHAQDQTNGVEVRSGWDDEQPSRWKWLLGIVDRIQTRCSLKNISTYATMESDTTKRVKKRSKLMNAVPAFSVPLTKVLNPIILRGQWEIVVRSAGLGFLVTWVVCALLLAIPYR